jgi:hypothetical protein
MMKINLLKHFPHQFLKHETPAGEKLLVCTGCMKVSSNRTPSQRWYDYIDAVEKRMGL